MIRLEKVIEFVDREKGVVLVVWVVCISLFLVYILLFGCIVCLFVVRNRKLEFCVLFLFLRL